MRVFLTAILFLAPLFAEEKQEYIKIDKGDVEQLLKGFPEIKKNFEKFGKKWEGIEPEEPFTTFQVFEKYANELDDVVKKQGYSSFENFYGEFISIVIAYAYLQYEKQKPEIEKSLKQAKEQMQALLQNPNISENEKQELIKNIKEIEKMEWENPFKDIPQENVNAVEPYIEKLKELLEE